MSVSHVSCRRPAKAGCRPESHFYHNILSSVLCILQSDILHQSVLELVHSEDRESLSQQLNWSNLLMHLGPNPTHADVSNLHAHSGNNYLSQLIITACISFCVWIKSASHSTLLNLLALKTLDWEGNSNTCIMKQLYIVITTIALL